MFHVIARIRRLLSSYVASVIAPRGIVNDVATFDSSA